MIHSYPWYIADWRSSETRIRLAIPERAIYRELLDYCWQEGSLPIEPNILAAICACDQREFNRYWKNVKYLFFEQDGRLHHARVDEGRPKLQSWQESRVKAGKKGGLGKAIALAKDQAIAKLSPWPSTSSTSTTTSTPSKCEVSKPFIDPSSCAENETPEYWSTKLINMHPKPSARYLVEQFCSDHWHRLGDAGAYAAYMGRISAGLAAWCRFWESNGTQYAPALEKWLSAQSWEKQPPIPRSNNGGMTRLIDLFPEVPNASE